MKVEDLKINQLIDVEMEYNGQKMTLSSRIEGIDDSSLLIATPIRKGVPLIVQSGHEMVIIFRQHQNSFGFNTQLIDKRLRPVPIWLVSKPQHFFKLAQKRTYVRLNINLPVRFQYAIRPDDQVIKGISVDISAGGILFTTSEKPQIGDKLQVELFLNDQEIICSQAQVIRVFDHEDCGPRNYRVAVEFLDISENQRDRIFKFIFEKQREWLRKGLLK